MMSKMFGAPLGGTACGGQYGLEFLASMLITPPKGGCGGGRYFPSIVVVALGEPGVPVICCASAGTRAATARFRAVIVTTIVFMPGTPCDGRAGSSRIGGCRGVPRSKRYGPSNSDDIGLRGNTR